MKQQTLVREEPRISINKLAEYLTCTPRKRNTIVKEQKRPPTFKAYYYQPSHDAIVNFLSSRGSHYSIITDAMDELKKTPIENDYQEHRVSTNLEALKIFSTTFSDALDLEGKTIKKGEFDPPKLVVEDVDVSVRPELITYRNDTTQKVGAIKLYFKKNDPLKSQPGNYAATALHKWVKDNPASASTNSAPCKDAIIYDVFSAKTISAPTAHINREKDIAAACTEIHAMWPHM